LKTEKSISEFLIFGQFLLFHVSQSILAISRVLKLNQKPSFLHNWVKSCTKVILQTARLCL